VVSEAEEADRDMRDAPADEASAFHLPRPTAWPAVMAAGITLFMAGFIINTLFMLAGVVIFGVALAGWIGELRR
jgi:hypothetical protein